MRRRRAGVLLGSLGGAAFAPALAQLVRAPRLGLLATFPPSMPAAAPLWDVFFGELAARGWHEARNLAVEGRYNEGNPARDATLATELLATRPDVVLATSSGAVDAMRMATRKLPIVMVNVSHAVEPGYVESLARPGGNVTGVTNQAGDMQGKFIELLRAVRPELRRLGIVWSPANQGSAFAFKDANAAASRLGLRVVSLPVDQAGTVESALATARREGVQALHVHPTPAIGSGWRQAMAWAIDNRAPTLGQATWVREGFLLSYWAYTADLFRIAAGFVDRILLGARPAEMPVEQPTRFELTVNLKTARAIGVAMPQSILLRADAVIE